MKTIFEICAIFICLLIVFVLFASPQEITGKYITGGFAGATCCSNMGANACGGTACTLRIGYCINVPAGAQACVNLGRACDSWLCYAHAGSNCQCSTSSLCF